MSDNSEKNEVFNPSNTRGLSGLNNIGNTCYMNSTLQALSNTNLFCHYLRNIMFRTDLKNGTTKLILKKLKQKTNLSNVDKVEISKKKIKHKFKSSVTYRTYQIMKILWNINCQLRPEKFKNSVDINLPKFRGLNQHDAPEFLIDMLDQIHEELKTDVVLNIKSNETVNAYFQTKDHFKKQIIEASNDEDKQQFQLQLNNLIKENFAFDIHIEGVLFYEKFIRNNHSIITDLFYGIFVNIIACKNCNNCSICYEPFNILQLELFQQENLNLESLIEHYFKAEEVDYNCENCLERGKAIKNIRIHTLPEKLIIQLKRFTFNGRQSRKNNILVKFPFTNFELKEFVKQDPTYYELYSVINHMGDVGGGHYTNYSKNGINNHWYEFNDSSVSYLSNPQVSIETPEAYVLFYQKQRQ